MLVGDRNRFAIEAEVDEVVGTWVLGRFRLWFGGRPVGNWVDTTDLKGSQSWLQEFADSSSDRHEPTLDGLDAADVLARVLGSVTSAPAAGAPTLRDAYVRFVISHLGMSSFDAVDLVIVDRSDGRRRCIWQTAGEPDVKEHVAEGGEMEDVARAFCEEFRRVHG